MKKNVFVIISLFCLPVFLNAQDCTVTGSKLLKWLDVDNDVKEEQLLPCFHNTDVGEYRRDYGSHPNGNGKKHFDMVSYIKDSEERELHYYTTNSANYLKIKASLKKMGFKLTKALSDDKMSAYLYNGFLVTTYSVKNDSNDMIYAITIGHTSKSKK